MMSEFRTVQNFHGAPREYIATLDGKQHAAAWAGLSYKYVAEDGEVRDGHNWNVREQLYSLMTGAA